MEPAASLVRKLGGPDVVAAALGVAYTAPYRWSYPADKGGTNGSIPRKYHAQLLELARERGVELTPADFVVLPSLQQEAAQ